MSSLSGEPRRLLTRVPTVVWAGLLALLIIGLFLAARSIILPFVLALFVTYLLMPLVELMTRPGRRGGQTPRMVAAFLAVGAFISVLAVAVLALGPLLVSEANHLARAVLGTSGEPPLIARRIAGTLQYWRDTLYGTGVFTPDIERQLDQEARDFVSGLGDAAASAFTASLGFFPKLLEVVAVPILTLYMLADGPRLAGEARSFLPPSQQAAAGELMGRIDRVLREYVRGQLLASLFIGVVVSIGLWLMGLRVALLIGAIAFFVEAIPFFGPLFWGTLAVVLALAQAPAGSFLPVAVAIFSIAAQQVDSHVAAPLILGRFCRVHPLLLIFSTLVGASLFGLIGMFLAAPVTAVAKVTFLFVMERVRERRATPTLSATA